MTFGFANPAGAAALVAAGVLVVLWLYERRRREVPVATLFLWRQVPASDLERHRFRPDLLFLLQLVLLLALIGGLMRPYVESAARSIFPARLCLVIDVSASMQAREDGSTRFELVRRRAATLLGELSGADEVMLVAAAERAHVLLRWTSDHARAAARLAALSPLDTPTDLTPALELALGEARARPATRVTVLTDLPPEASGIGRDALEAVDWIQVGESDDNLAIAGLSVDAPPFGTIRDASAMVLVRNYAHAARRVALEATVGGELWARRELALAARGAERVVLTAPPRSGELVARLLADDALAVDDRAVGWIGEAAPLDLLLVTESRALGGDFEALAAAIPGSRVEVVNRARWAEAPPLSHRAALFDAFVPAAGAQPINALYVAPPHGNTVCPSEDAVERATVVDWEADHPMIGDLGTLEGVEAVRAHRLMAPVWGRAIVLAASRRAVFPLLVAGERDGRRVACLGAELLAPIASSDRLPLLVLTLATLRWLEEPSAAAALAVTTGVPALLGVASSESIDPGIGLRVAGDPPVVLAERVGSYRLGAQHVLANLFDERESDIGRSAGRERRAAARPAAARTGGDKREIEWWLYLVAAAFLGLEWLVWLRRERA